MDGEERTVHVWLVHLVPLQDDLRYDELVLSNLYC